MKKILITFVLLLTALLSFGQSSSYLRAESFKIGDRYSSGKIVWDESTTTPCDILIKLDDNSVTIYSKERQIYKVISMTTNSNQGGQWYCVDNKGFNCNIYLISLKNLPGKLALGVEYSDYVWYYVCHSDN